MFDDIERFGEAVALIDQNGAEITYRDLVALADASAEPLGRHKRLVAIEASNTLEAISAYVGALRANHAVILAKRGAQDDRILSTFRPSFILREDAVGWECLDADDASVIHADLAILLSSSGSSGTPKMIRLSHANLIANALSIVEYLEITQHDRALTTLPLFYSYGLSVVHSHLLAGASLVLDSRSVTDPELWQRFEAQTCSSFAGVPHTFELLERTDFFAGPPRGLRYVTVAGGKLSAERVSTFATALADVGVRFFVMYGQTEAAPRIAYLPAAAALTHPGAIGRAIPGGELHLEDEHGQLIAQPGVIGEMIYRGPNVMMGYAEAPGDLALGKDVYSLRTGDLATFDDNGYFTIVGRLSRFVKLFGLRIDLEDAERWCRERSPGAAVAGDDQGIVVATLGSANVKLGQDLAEKLGIPSFKVCTIGRTELPRLESGKIDYPGVLRAGRPTRTAEAPAPGAIASALGRLVPRGEIGEGESFIEAGGDSLNIIAASLIIEERLGYAPPGWERMSMAEIERLDAKQAPGPGVSADALARCVCVLLIVLHHGANIALDGAATGLLLIAGFNFGRLQAPAVSSQGPWITAYRSLRRIVPLYLGIMALYFVLKRDIFLPNIFFYSTFTNGYDDGTTVIGLYWFIETYAWLILCGCLVAAIPLVSRLERERNILLPLSILALAIAAHIATTPIGRVLPAIEMRSPVYLAYVFALGWAITFGTTGRRKLLLCVIALAILVLLPAHKIPAGAFVTVSVALLLIWTTRIEFAHASAARLCSQIASASLYIYLAHPLVFIPLLKVFGTGAVMGVQTRVIGALVATLPLSVLAGILLHSVVARGERMLEGFLRQRRPFAPSSAVGVASSRAPDS